MILAELVFYHSRLIAPTRRVALGDSLLPCDPAPGPGGVLLGGVVAANVRSLDEDLLPDLGRLARELEEGSQISQPRLRYRFQRDRVGLLRSHLRLVRRDDRLEFDFQGDRSSPAQRVLAALYAAGDLEPAPRRAVFAAIRRAMRWEGPIGPVLIASLSAAAGGPPLAALTLEDPVGWALSTLGFAPVAVPDPRDGEPAPSSREVQQRFRVLLREAHPDHGGAIDSAAQRIADLREARRILLAG